ncbi:MAG: 50S ribosomal protein L29 [Patescibacteria group bacterium]|jgi:ribosomal protein L29
MKKEEKQKLTNLGKEELLKEIEKERSALVKLKMDKSLGRLKNIHEIGKKRAKIAFMLNLIQQKEA